MKIYQIKYEWRILRNQERQGSRFGEKKYKEKKSFWKEFGKLRSMHYIGKKNKVKNWTIFFY